jgi:hypothetical protein
MIGLPRVTPWRWLLPPARGLAPASVVVVEAWLGPRMSADRLAVALAAALAHALIPNGGRRVMLIQLDPGTLRGKKCLTHIRVITALENGRNPGDVSHRSPDASFAYGGELKVKLAMHTSPALVDPSPPDCASPVPGPPCHTIGVVLVAGVGCDLIFGDRFKLMMGRSPSSSPSSAISTWREASSSELVSTSSVDSSATVANGLPSWKGRGSRWATSRSSASSRSESFIPSNLRSALRVWR